MTNAISIAQGGSSNTTFRNRIINGAMWIDQRNAGTAFSSPAGSNTYGSCDRWASIASAATWTLQQVSTGNFDFPYALRLKRTAAATASTLYVGQVIETNNCQDLAGQPVTLSFYVTAGANYSGGTFTIEIWTGTGTNQGWASLGSATWTNQTLAVSTTAVPTTTRTKYSYTATLGSTVSEVAVRFTYAATGTAGANDYVDITGVQLEAGSKASPFEQRLYGTELALCQRYYAALGAGSWGYIYTSTGADASVQFPVTMRTTPSVAHLANYSIVLIATASYTVTNTVINPSVSGTNTTGCGLRLTSTGMTTGNAWLTNGNNVGFSAEL